MKKELNMIPCDGEIDIMEQWGGNYFTNGTTGAA